MGPEDDVFSMADGLGDVCGNVDPILWDDEDDSWAFPILTAEENNGGSLKGKEVEVEVEAVAAPPAKGKKRKDGGGNHHEQHILVERERRKKMRDMFSSLHSLIPHLPPRTDKATIVDEAVEYIKKLQTTLGSLKKRKAEMLGRKTCIPSMLNRFSTEGAVASANPNWARPDIPTVFKTWTSPNVILNVFGKDAHINICCPKRPGLLTGICFVLEKHVLEVVSAEVSSDSGGCMCMIHARGNGGVVEFAGSVCTVEQIFKQAAAEIMVLIQNQCV